MGDNKCNSPPYLDSKTLFDVLKIKICQLFNSELNQNSELLQWSRNTKIFFKVFHVSLTTIMIAIHYYIFEWMQNCHSYIYIYIFSGDRFFQIKYHACILNMNISIFLHITCTEKTLHAKSFIQIAWSLNKLHVIFCTEMM